MDLRSQRILILYSCFEDIIINYMCFETLHVMLFLDKWRSRSVKWVYYDLHNIFVIGHKHFRNDLCSKFCSKSFNSKSPIFQVSNGIIMSSVLAWENFKHNSQDLNEDYEQNDRSCPRFIRISFDRLVLVWKIFIDRAC